VRLLGEAGRHGNDPELFAGLVHACRYCGLFEQSIAAHDEARRLDPNVPSGVEGTILMMGDVERLLAFERPASAARSDSVLRVIGLGLAGRRDEARLALAAHHTALQVPAFQSYAGTLMDWLDGRSEELLVSASTLGELKIAGPGGPVPDRLAALTRARTAGASTVRRAVGNGYTVAPTLAARASTRCARPAPRAAGQAEAGRQQALAAFREAAASRLLGR
jgi:hypothetical protein